MTFRLVDAGWGAEFESALSIDHSELRIVCPFIKARALDRLLAFRPQNVHVITRYNLDDFARRVSDIAALRTLLDRGASVRGIRNLHAKLYIFGQSRAIVTSANLTHAGLERNPEFGIVTEDPAAIASCLDYFDDLWRSGGADLRIQQVNSWTAMLTDHLASGASTKGSTTLEDFGVDAGLVAPPKIALPAPFTGAEQGFVKFLGRSDNRYPLSRRILEQLESGGCHWALTYPRGKRPRQVKDGDVMFIALLTDEPDIRVFGRAVALKHEPDRDDATPRGNRATPMERALAPLYPCRQRRVSRRHDCERRLAQGTHEHSRSGLVRVYARKRGAGFRQHRSALRVQAAARRQTLPAGMCLAQRAAAGGVRSTRYDAAQQAQKARLA